MEKQKDFKIEQNEPNLEKSTCLFRRPFKFENNINEGLLLLRVTIGIMMFLHGLPKLLGGSELWIGLGNKALPFIHNEFLLMFSGLSASIGETILGLFLVLGFMHRFTCSGLTFIMLVAASTKVMEIEGILSFSKTIGWPLELMFVFIALLVTGPGKYNVMKYLKSCHSYKWKKS